MIQPRRLTMRSSEALARGQSHRALGRVRKIPMLFIGIAIPASRVLCPSGRTR